MIENSAIELAGYEIMKKAAIDIPEDYLGGIKSVQKQETNQLSGYVIKTMIDNYEAATEDRRPMCADTGLPRYYVKIGDNARFGGGFTGIERALRSATARATGGARGTSRGSAMVDGDPWDLPWLPAAGAVHGKTHGYPRSLPWCHGMQRKNQT